MKKWLGAALMAAQLAGTPVVAASLAPVEQIAGRAGAFAGARLHIGLGGRDSGRQEAGLGIGPIRTAQGADGRIHTSIGDGMSFGVAGASKPKLSLAGRSLENWRLRADAKGGVPTWALIAGGAVLVLGVAAFATYAAVGDAATE